MGLVLGSDLTGAQLAERIAALAAGKQHRLASYQVDGKHPVTPAAADGIMKYLSRCADLPGQRTTEEDMARYAPVQGGQEARAQANAVIADIPGGFYATPSRTGNNDLDFWKVTEGRKAGVRFAKRVVGGGDAKYPRLVEVTQQEQRAALGAILRTGISKASEDYADNQERCKKCGIHLTDDESRTARMGPVCRGDR
jgi:hypothetical protein